MKAIAVGIAGAAALVLGSGSPLHAGDLRAPLGLESSAVLPKGVGNPRIMNIFGTVDSKFNSNGTTEPVGLRLNQTVTWKDVLNGQKTQTDREKVQLLLNQIGAAETGQAGQTTGEVNAYTDVKVPVLGFGVTERLTLAVAVPIVHAEVSADTGFVKSGQGQAFVNAAYQSSEWSGTDAAAKFNDGVNRVLVENGYEPISDQNVTSVGDVQLISKYMLDGDEKNSYALKSTLTFPTGVEANPDRIVDAATGDGQFDMSVGVVWDHKITPELNWGSGFNYNMQFADYVTKRIPTSANSSITPDKEEIRRDLGDQISLASGLSYEFPKAGLTFGAGYAFQYMGPTTYDPGQYDPARYRWLEDQSPQQTLHSGTLTAQFSTVKFYRKKEFVYPFQANFVYSTPLSGRNTGTNSVYVAELVMFF